MTKNILTNDQLSLKVYDSISRILEKDWIDLTTRQDTFVQSHCEWIKAWSDVKKLSGKLHIVTIYCEGKIVGIAPFKLEKSLFGNTLQSIPIHFGDFISFISISSMREKVLSEITRYLLSYKSWSFIKVDNVCSDDYLYKHLEQCNLHKKSLSKAHIVGFGGYTFDEYLMSLSKNRRNKTNKQIRQLKKSGELSFEVVEDFTNYESHFDEMRGVYVSRWGKDISEDIYQYRNTALKGLFPKGNVKLFILKLDGKMVAYHLGFVFNGNFYSWKEAAHAEFANYSAGNMMRVFFIPEYLIEHDIDGINFMAGDYDYKSNRVGEDGRIENISAFYLGKGVYGKVLQNYYLVYRDELKKIKTWLTRFRNKI